MKDQTEREITNSQGSVTVDRFAKVLPSRRRLITGGLVAAPILASIESRNALAVACLTPSGNLSGNVSTGAQAGTCTGFSASYWDHLGQSSWPKGHAMANTNFYSIFATGPYATFGDAPLKEVVGYHANGNEAKSLAAYIVAGYLNVMNGGLVSVPGLDHTAMVNLLKSIWGDYAVNKAYKINSAASWSASQIKFYLTSNGIVGT